MGLYVTKNLPMREVRILTEEMEISSSIENNKDKEKY